MRRRTHKKNKKKDLVKCLIKQGMSNQRIKLTVNKCNEETYTVMVGRKHGIFSKEQIQAGMIKSIFGDVERPRHRGKTCKLLDDVERINHSEIVCTYDIEKSKHNGKVRALLGDIERPKHR